MTTEIKENEGAQDFESLLDNYTKNIVVGAEMAHTHRVIAHLNLDLNIKSISNFVVIPDTDENGKPDGQVSLLQGETPQDFGELKTTVHREDLDTAIKMADSLGYSIVAVPTEIRGGSGKIADYNIQYNIYATPKPKLSDKQELGSAKPIVEQASTDLDADLRVKNNIADLNEEQLSGIIHTASEPFELMPMFIDELTNRIEKKVTDDLAPTIVSAHDIYKNREERHEQRLYITIIQRFNDGNVYYYKCESLNAEAKGHVRGIQKDYRTAEIKGSLVMSVHEDKSKDHHLTKDFETEAILENNRTIIIVKDKVYKISDK